jgi:hypothetical protein
MIYQTSSGKDTWALTFGNQWVTIGLVDGGDLGFNQTLGLVYQEQTKSKKEISG